MIQMRWFHYNDGEEPVLQYRVMQDTSVYAGMVPTGFEKMEWSWWIDVPHEHYVKKLGQNENTNNTPRR